MRSRGHTLFAVGFAFLLVAAAMGGAATIGGLEEADEQREGSALESVAQLGAAISPVGQADAVLLTLSAGMTIVGLGLAGCAAFCDSADTAKVESTDAEQAKIDIYSSAAGAHDQAEVALTGISNYLDDSDEIALMVGKNAAIREYMNGSTEIQAEQAARNAVEDYYSKKQIRLIKSWNISLTHFDYLENVAYNETGVTSSNQSTSAYTYVDGSGNLGYYPTFDGVASETFTLQNGTTVNVAGAQMISYDGETNPPSSSAHPYTISIDQGSVTGYNPAQDFTYSYYGLSVRASVIGSSYENLPYLQFDEYANTLSSVESKTTSAASEVVTFVNATYPEWESGAINETQLIDPYLGAREYSPNGDYQSWALSSYSAMGLGTPENLSTFGSMEILSHSDNEIVNGILMSDGLPENDTFEVGPTYNATELSGLQYVVTGSQAYELEGNFEILNMTNAEGTTVNKTVYRNITYESGNLSQYQKLSEEMQELRNELEAAKQRALGGGGWALPDFGFGGLVTLLAAIAALLMLAGAVIVFKE